MSKKITRKDLGISFEGMPNEQRIFMEKNLDAMCEVINKAFAGHATPEEVKEKFKEINDTLKGFNGEQYAQLIKDNQTLSEQVQKMAETIEKLQKKGIGMTSLTKFEESIDAMLDSDRFKEFAEGQTRKSGVFEGFTLKDIVSMSDNYEGELLITQQQPRVVSSVNNKRLHLRDVITVLTGDPKYPNLAFTRVYDFDRNARYVTENGMLPQSSLKLKEESYTTKRLGTHIHISKRMLKSRAFIKSWIINMLPEAVYMAEDWNMLFGDGNGENLDGIANTKGVESIESIINGAIVSGAAGSIKSVIPYNNGKDTIIEFTNPVDAIQDGMMITLAKATATELNKANPIVKMNDRQVLLHGVALSAEEATPNAITYTVNHSAFQSIETPNSEDVIRTAFAVMNIGQFYPNAIILNPITVNAIESEKDTLGRSLNLVKIGADGVKRIGVFPVIEYTGMQPGKYLMGDFKQGANLVDYTSLSLEWAQDVNTELKNEVVLIAQEEVIFPIYMPWAFAYGDLAALKAAITKTDEVTTGETTTKPAE